MLPDSFGADGHDLYFDISIWDPYTTVLMTMRLSTSSTTDSTSQTASKSNTAASPSTTTSSEQPYGTALILPLSIAVVGCGIAVIVSRKHFRRKENGASRLCPHPNLVLEI
jgi:hypothetical protein